MADIVQANYESLAVVAKRFVQQSNKMRQMHSQLNRQVALLRPTWVGRGSEAFFAEMTDKVLPGVQRLGAALADADRVTRQIEELLRSAEEQGSSPFQQDAQPGFGALPYGPGGDLGGAGGSAEGGSGGGESGAAEELAYAGGSRDFDETGGSATGYDEGLGGVGDEAGGGAGGGDESGGAGSASGASSGRGLGEDFVRDLEDFGQEFSIDNLGSGSGGAWGDDSFQPFDINDPLFDQLQDNYAFGDTDDFGGGEPGSLGSGGDGSYTVPDDWLAGVEQAFGSPWNDDLGQDLSGAGGSGSGGDMGGASGGGGDSGGGGGGGDTGGAGSGSAPMGSASPAGGAGQAPAAAMPAGQGSPIGTSSQPAAAALPGPLRYAAIGGGGAGGGAAAAGAQTSGSAAAGAAVPQAAQANVGVPMGLAALAPLLALVGKAVKDRSSGR